MAHGQARRIGVEDSQPCYYDAGSVLDHIFLTCLGVLGLLVDTVNFVLEVHGRKLNESKGLINRGGFACSSVRIAFNGYFHMNLLLYYRVYTGLSNRDKYAAVPISVPPI